MRRSKLSPPAATAFAALAALAVLAALAALPLLTARPALAQELQTDEQKTLYALGKAVGQNVARAGVTKEDLAFVIQGLTDHVGGVPSKVDMAVYGPKIQELARARMQARAEAEKVRSKAFLEQVAKEKGAVVEASGLVFIPQKEGTGTAPKATDRVKVHYRGTLQDGTEFDSSYKRNEPAEFPLSGVIPCWTEGLQKMKPGGKARLICPAAIGYGDRGTPDGSIPGGAALAFEVELLEILPATPPAAAPPAPAPAPAPSAAPAPAPAPKGEAPPPPKK